MAESETGEMPRERARHRDLTPPAPGPTPTPMSSPQPMPAPTSMSSPHPMPAPRPMQQPMPAPQPMQAQLPQQAPVPMQAPPTVPGTPRRLTAREVFDFGDRPARVTPRTSVLEWIGLVLAVVTPPVGLLVTIAARIVTRHRHHWTTTVAKAATVVSIVLTLLLGVGAVGLAIVNEQNAAAARVVAEAQPLCDGLAATPGVLDLEAYGWPTEIAPIAVTLDAMRVYQARWQQLADLAPASAAVGTTAIADQAAMLVGAVETSQAIDRTSNLAAMTAVTDASGLPQFVATYCG